MIGDEFGLKVDVVIIGAGAAGLMCAIEASKRGQSVLVLDKANKVGKKILMSGGGRCNFTNYYIEPDKYLSHNLHFCKSALSRYTPWDFIAKVEKHDITYYEKTLGQLFCREKSSEIVNMLLKECDEHHVVIQLKQDITKVRKIDIGFFIQTQDKQIHASSLVIASGGLSIPTMGASPFGYHIADQFGLKVCTTRAALVPFTLHQQDKLRFEALSGVSAECEVMCRDMSFREMLLFTHRGLSGPAMLQISSYWQAGDTLAIKLLPDVDLCDELIRHQQHSPELRLKTILATFFAKRLIAVFIEEADLNKPMKQFNQQQLINLANVFQQWKIKPNGTEGYRTAEVTIGGIDCDELSSKTFESKKISGLYFIGEVIDVSGWLGGYNFQWAWSSGWAAGQVV